MAQAERAGGLDGRWQGLSEDGGGRWIPFDTRKARAAQERLAPLVKYERGLLGSRVVAGLDVAYGCGASFAAAVAVDRSSMEVVASAVSALPEKIPYIPGLLAFREAGPMISAVRRLPMAPDALMVNGHGVAHPRRFGIASHVGVALGLRSVGVARRRLVGREEQGSVYIDGEEVARVIEAAGVRLYVSVGHRATLDEAVELVSSMAVVRGKLPMPLQGAHDLATREARSCR